MSRTRRVAVEGVAAVRAAGRPGEAQPGPVVVVHPVPAHLRRPPCDSDV